MTQRGTVGPYRILDRLGAGGMGEVLLAYDERLDRQVAIKRIRPEAGERPDRRERLRREARTAARLNHPAIVQVYDILTQESTDYIVMEYVEGATLRQLVSRGPLDLSRGLALARQVTAALGAAHRQGVVHRDLKTENVLVSPSDVAKIADFGIAKRLLNDDEESLTRPDMVVGTFRAMAPEQVRGGTVDHRSDLFSLGVLFYEIFTGISPFEGENALTTADRILNYRQRPARELNPAVPERLSSLIDRLLQKDPALRPRSAAEAGRELDEMALELASGSAATLVEGPGYFSATAAGVRRRALRWTMAAAAVAALVLLGIAAASVLTRDRRPANPLYVAVLPPEIAASRAGLVDPDLAAEGVRTALLQGLIGLEGISPKDPKEIGDNSGTPLEVARAVAADEMVTSRLQCRPGVCRVTLNRLAGGDGAVRWSGSFDVPADEASALASAVTHQIRLGYGDFQVRQGTLDPELSSAALADYLRLLRRFEERRDPTLGGLLAEVAALRERWPRFVDVYLLEADVARFDFNSSRDPQELTRALERLTEARRLAPGDPRPLIGMVAVARDAGDPRRAAAALAQLERLMPGDAQVSAWRGHLLLDRGKTEAGLSLLRAAAETHPSAKRLFDLALTEHRLGRVVEARRDLARLLERSPRHVYGRSLLAQIELTSGDPARAAAIYEELVVGSPRSNDLSNLGTAYLLLGRYSDAAVTLSRVTEAEPRNPFYALNLADSYLLMGDRAQAREVYDRVLGLTELPSGEADPELLTVRAQALVHLGQGTRAVAAVLEAQRRGPDNAETAYDAALVYAVLGEASSALANAEHALELGYEPRWFSFPWFDSLRRNPEFAALLKRALAGRTPAHRS